jgi:hypothetical protein
MKFGPLAALAPVRGTKFRLASLAPDDAERWTGADAHCSMIIYNVGGASVADHKHLKMDQGLRACAAAGAQLVILFGNDSRDDIFSALTQNCSSVSLR